MERTKELFLDWLGSALAGKNERPVRILERFAGEMGPSEGPSEVLGDPLDLLEDRGLKECVQAGVLVYPHALQSSLSGPA